MKNEINYTKVMGMNCLGRLILRHHPKRENEALSLLKLSEDVAAQLPYWYDSLEYIYVPEFDLD